MKTRKQIKDLLHSYLYSDSVGFTIADIPEEEYNIGKEEALKVYHKQVIKGTVSCIHSTAICDSGTIGYGRCDMNGYFEFPLPVGEGHVVIPLLTLEMAQEIIAKSIKQVEETPSYHLGRAIFNNLPDVTYSYFTGRTIDFFHWTDTDKVYTTFFDHYVLEIGE